MTHRFGGTVDIRPIGTKKGSVKVGDAHYHRNWTGAIINALSRSGATEIRFADNLPGVTRVDSSHKNHIHVSWLLKPSEPWFVPDSSVTDDDTHDEFKLIKPDSVSQELALSFFGLPSNKEKEEINLELSELGH